MPEKVDSQIVRLWLERLRTGSEKERAQAASELSRLHIRNRGSVRTRGSLSHSASSEFPPELSTDAMSIVLTALRDESPAIRREVAFALGEWGNEEAANILARMLCKPGQDQEAEVRRACIAALKTIGGRVAVQALRMTAESDESEAVRYDAVAALAELALEAYPAPTAPRSAIRTRGTPVRPRRDLSPEAQEILETLARIRDNEQEKEYLRLKAEAAIAPLQD